MLLLWIAGVLVALIVFAIVFLPLLINEQAIVELAQQSVREELGGELRVSGETDLALFPTLRIVLNDTELSLPAKTDYDSAITARIANLDVGVSLIPMLMGSTEVGGVSLSGVVATITAPKAAPPASAAQEPILSDAQWEERGRLRRQAMAEQRAFLAQQTPSTEVSLALDKLALEDIAINLLSAEGETQTQIRVSQLSLVNINTQEQPISLDGALNVSSPGAVPLDITLEGDIRVPSTIEQVKLENLRYAVTGLFAEPLAGSLNGLLNVSPLTIDATLTSNTPGGAIKGEMRYALLESPQISLAISTDKLDTTQLVLLAPETAAAADHNAVAVTPEVTTPPTGEKAISGNAANGSAPLPVAPLRDLDVDVQLTGNTLLIGAHTLQEAAVGLRIVDGVVRLHQLKGNLHGGQLDANVTLNIRRPVVELDAEGGVVGTDIDALLSAEGMTDTAKGIVNITWDIESEGRTADSLLEGLEGDLAVVGDDLGLVQFSAQNLMCTAIAQVNQRPLSRAIPPGTDVSALELRIEFDEGKADIDTLALATPGVALSGEGAVALASQDFALTLKAKIGETLSDLDPACKVNERYVAIDWPVKCKGNLEGEPKEWCAIDVESIVKQLLENEAKSKLRKETEKLTEKVGEKATDALKKLFGN